MLTWQHEQTLIFRPPGKKWLRHRNCIVFSAALTTLNSASSSATCCLLGMYCMIILLWLWKETSLREATYSFKLNSPTDTTYQPIRNSNMTRREFSIVTKLVGCVGRFAVKKLLKRCTWLLALSIALPNRWPRLLRWGRCLSLFTLWRSDGQMFEQRLD